MTHLIFKTDIGKVIVSISEADKYGIAKLSGSLFGVLVTGGSYIGKYVRPAIKMYAEINNIKIGTIKHCLYGSFKADILP